MKKYQVPETLVARDKKHTNNNQLEKGFRAPGVNVGCYCYST